MEAAGIKGYFTGHSLRRSGGSHLFQAGVQRKLVMETTGHTSDAVDTYQITSDEQHQKISKILSQKPELPSGPNDLTIVTGGAVEPQVCIENKDCSETKSELNPSER